MGQDWILVNLDKRECYRSLGKLGESLFNGGPSYLDYSLSVLELPNCDSVVRPYKPGEPFRDLMGGGWIYYARTAKSSADPLAIVNMPLELIQEIHAYLGEFIDLLFLSMTCQVLWEAARAEIYHRLATDAASHFWAGDRIICVGDYLRNDDIPEHIFSSEERAEFLGLDEDYTLYDYPFHIVKKGPFSSDKVIDSMKLWNRIPGSEDTHVLRELLQYAPTYTIPRVLRNLSRHQYVHESALRQLRKKYVGTNIERDMRKIGFGEVVCCRIGLSSDPSASLCWKGDIHRGPWAGDRFDIVGAEWLQEAQVDDNAVGWADVSEEVLKEVEDIWLAEFGWELRK